MGFNQSAKAIIHHFTEPFQFETPYMGEPEFIPELFMAYESWGDPDNPAILVCHALTGNTHATDPDAPDDWRRSWWPAMVGPGKAIDTNQFYVLCINILGGCGGTSGPATVHPETKTRYGLHFPIVEMEDIVCSQKKLLDALGVKRLYAVIGGSLGGFQALVWGRMYPDFVDRLIVIASSAYSNQFMILTNRVQIDAIQMDPLYQEGNYLEDNPPDVGLRLARMVGFTTFISPITMEKKFSKYHASQREPYADASFHQQMFHDAENYIRKVSAPFTTDFDANSMVYLLQTWNHFDLAIKYGSLAKALEPVLAKTLIIAATGDNLFPPYLSEDILKALEATGKKASLTIVDENYGHDFFLKPNIILEKLTDPIVRFLEK
ncbi:MAG: homoserine O-acetyltransferase [Deltaproteobacteria bacterium]|nr:homoserine O-acetyltransferase [Deltaproteobacteria bacterium]